LIESEKVVLLGVVDLLFAYAYDVRTTMGESTVESGWTIVKLSSQLSWLDVSVCVLGWATLTIVINVGVFDDQRCGERCIASFVDVSIVSIVDVGVACVGRRQIAAKVGTTRCVARSARHVARVAAQR
jgi:hypothetical protein